MEARVQARSKQKRAHHLHMFIPIFWLLSCPEAVL